MIDKVMNTLSRAVMYLIIDPNLSANFVKQRSHVTLYLCIWYWNLILLVKIKLIKFIVAEPPPLTSGTSQSRNTIIGTVAGFLILVVGGLLFGIIIIVLQSDLLTD
jgi:hypothetical protein